MKLKKAPFEMIKSGQKIYELRLYDEKRRSISPFDEIIFTLDGNESEKLRCTVKELCVFQSFKELYLSLPLLECGYTAQTVKSASYLDMERYYSADEQKKFKVVGIKIELIK